MVTFIWTRVFRQDTTSAHRYASARTAVGARKVFNAFYEAAQKVVVPGLRYSRSVYEDLLEESVTPDCAWMDLGCGHKILAGHKAAEEQELTCKPRLLVGLDRDLEALNTHGTVKQRVCGVAARLPFRDDTFDLVTSNMVFEHLDETQAPLAEILRVLKPGGALIFHTPNTLGYSTVLARLIPRVVKARLIYFLQRRTGDDVFPAFYLMNTSSAVRGCAEGSGFVVKEIRSLVSGGELLMIPPLVLLELLWIRILKTRRFERLRTHLIVHLTKPRPGGR